MPKRRVYHQFVRSAYPAIIFTLLLVLAGIEQVEASNSQNSAVLEESLK